MDMCGEMQSKSLYVCCLEYLDEDAAVLLDAEEIIIRLVLQNKMRKKETPPFFRVRKNSQTTFLSKST